jgi:phospholipid transport system substrate-binding protein
MALKLFRILLVSALLSSAPSYAGDANSVAPDAFIKQTAADVIADLKADSGLIRQHDKMEAYVETKILGLFDFAYMTQLTMGETEWGRATAEEKSELVAEYRLLMAHAFSNTLGLYDNQSVTIESFQIAKNSQNVLVQGKLIDPDDGPNSLNFRLEKTNDGWKIYDVELAGIDLIRTYRIDFQAALRSGGVKKLINQLHKKTGK